MSHFENRPNVSPSFKVDLCCNINIEVHVAMRLGELIKASRTEDKQLMALGHRLSSAMVHLVEQLDNRQWDRLHSYMDEQSQDDSYEGDDSSNEYVSRARSALPKNDEYKSPIDMKDYISSMMSRKE